MNGNARVSGSVASAILVLLTAFICASTSADIVRFRPTDSRAIEVWRITNDPRVRDHANYHNTQCWSPDGRFIAYTHWAANDREFGAKSAAGIHLFDLHEKRDRLVERGLNPRWANRRPWLFYTHLVPDAGPRHGRGTEVIWCDVATGRRTRIAYGVGELKETDCGDRWLYGMWTPEDGRRRAVRIPIQADSEFEILPGDWGVGYNSLYVNPTHPVIVSRDHNYRDYYYATEGTRDVPFVARHFFDHDLAGEKRTAPFPLMDGSHFSWNGDGSWFLAGNGPVRGKRWNEALPCNVHWLANISMGDICPCGFSARWICGSTGGGRGPLRLADTRSGEGWEVMRTHSFLCFPNAQDNSGPYDIDAKGSPDGTKIAFVSTYDLVNGPATEIARDSNGDRIVVASTEGFPETGRLVNPAGFGGEVISYARKTPTSFEGIRRGLYGTSSDSRLSKGRRLTSFESLLIPESQRRLSPLPPSGIRRIVGDMDSPLMWQRSSDIYVAVVRRPDPPHLRKSGNVVQLIPGENHWETCGYHLFRSGNKITERPLRPGESFRLSAAGRYTAVAVEWSGLESRPSLPLDLDGPAPLKVLEDKPADFSWTFNRYRFGDMKITEAEVKRVRAGTSETVHLHDGVIHRTTWYRGMLAFREDLNSEGKPIRRLVYEDGRLERREYHDRDGNHISTELFDTDGYITEAIRHGGEHWWYRRGVPDKYVRRNVGFRKQGNRWIRFKPE